MLQPTGDAMATGEAIITGEEIITGELLFAGHAKIHVRSVQTTREGGIVTFWDPYFASWPSS